MFRRLIFNLWYLRRPPWDSGITPPELKEFIATHDPGRALDIGCGSGTNVVALAEAGWQVTGVDFAPQAVKKARAKVRQAGVSADLRVGDATQLKGITGPFDLALDIGCFHGLGAGKVDYLAALDRVLAPGGSWLMYGFFKSPPDHAGPGLAAPDLGLIHAHFALISRQDGFDKHQRPSAWFLYQKP
ncbi:MAG: class I SAM-dependent methyltransferase [Chloroflexota bacterium]